VKQAFAPAISADARVVILGSLPGAASLAQARYYGHPRNQFWRLTGAVVGRSLDSLTYDDRLAALADARIGLWDVVAEADRTGSLDAAIRAPRINALDSLCEIAPDLRAVAFNGGTAARLGQRHIRVPTLTLPSSSPAYTLSFDAKRSAWLALRDYL
jgi:double-stranded uracil-DNA glycosylase